MAIRWYGKFPERMQDIFSEENREEVRGYGKQPVSLFAYERGYYKDRYYNTFFDIHKELRTDGLVKEFDEVLHAFDTFCPTFGTLLSFMREKCDEHPSKDEANYYAEGDEGFYWIRLISRDGDYNRYIKCFSKERAGIKND